MRLMVSAVALVWGLALVGCSSDDHGRGGGSSGNVGQEAGTENAAGGGAGASGGARTTGGAQPEGGDGNEGGGLTTGGSTPEGGSVSVAGAEPQGGVTPEGGAPEGGAIPVGGLVPQGGGTSAHAGSGGAGGTSAAGAAGAAGSAGVATTCAVQASPAACVECCDTETSGGYQAFVALLYTGCGCESGSPCEAECSANLCAGETSDAATCLTCVARVDPSMPCYRQTVQFCQMDEDCLKAMVCTQDCASI